MNGNAQLSIADRHWKPLTDNFYPAASYAFIANQGCCQTKETSNTMISDLSIQENRFVERRRDLHVVVEPRTRMFNHWQIDYILCPWLNLRQQKTLLRHSSLWLTEKERRNDADGNAEPTRRVDQWNWETKFHRPLPARWRFAIDSALKRIIAQQWICYPLRVIFVTVRSWWLSGRWSSIAMDLRNVHSFCIDDPMFLSTERDAWLCSSFFTKPILPSPEDEAEHVDCLRKRMVKEKESLLLFMIDFVPSVFLLDRPRYFPQCPIHSGTYCSIQYKWSSYSEEKNPSKSTQSARRRTTKC